MLTNTQKDTYGALAGGVLGTVAGAYYGGGKPGGRILYGMGGFLLGALAGGAVTTLVSNAAAPTTPQTGTGALPRQGSANSQLTPR